MELAEVNLGELQGEHLLSGVDDLQEEVSDGWGGTDNVNVFLVRLGDKTYKFSEDPDDGYRSYLSTVFVVDTEVSYKFPPQKVYAAMKPRDESDYYDHEILQFFDAENHELVLEVGTDDVEDYYPTCVMHWYPQNLSVNR
jgi:hypothetical protein